MAARFQKKRGSVGWPGPQVQRIRQTALRYGWDIEREAQAETGTVYLTMSREADADTLSVTVRVADHADAYSTADFTVDPLTGNIGTVLDYLKRHGEKRPSARGDRAAFVAIRGVGLTAKKSGHSVDALDGDRVVFTVRERFVDASLHPEYWDRARRVAEELKRDFVI